MIQKKKYDGDIVGWFYRNGKRIPIRQSAKKGSKETKDRIGKNAVEYNNIYNGKNMEDNVKFDRKMDREDEVRKRLHDRTNKRGRLSKEEMKKRGMVSPNDEKETKLWDYIDKNFGDDRAVQREGERLLDAGLTASEAIDQIKSTFGQVSKSRSKEPYGLSNMSDRGYDSLFEGMHKKKTYGERATSRARKNLKENQEWVKAKREEIAKRNKNK